MKTANVEKRTEDTKEINSCFLTIKEDIIEEAMKADAIKKVAEHTSRKGNVNAYYEISNKHNNILMHVRNNMYVIISRYICSPSEELVDAIPYLLPFSFCIGMTGSNRCHVMAECPRAIQRKRELKKTIYLSRILASLEMFGDIRDLDSTYDVHHKGDCYDNRQYMTMYIPRADHKHRDSHMTGGEIKTYENLIQHFKYLAWNYYKLKDITTVQ